MEENVTVRAARQADLPVVLEFVRALARYEELEHLVLATEDSLREAIFGDRPVIEVALAFVGEIPVGFAVYFRNFSTFLGRQGLWLEDLFVLPEHRGKGAGKALLRHCAAVARSRGCGRFEWAALDWNQSAWAFYRSLGAEPLQEWTMFRVTGTALERLASPD